MENSTPGEETGPAGVGAFLRAARQRCGEDVETAAAVLKIRAVYLTAIELGQWQELPGRAYVIGFIRAYAEHLGLDGDEIIRRFKAEAAVMHSFDELIFPSPVSEGRVPGGVLVMLSVLLAVTVYGGWYLYSLKERKAAEPLLEAAQHLAPPTSANFPPPVAAPPAPAPVAAAPPPIGTAEPPAAPEPAPNADLMESAGKPPETPPRETGESPPPPPPPSAAPAAPATPLPAAPPAPAAPTPATAAPAAGAPVASASPAAPAPANADAEKTKGRTYGIPEPGRVVITAHAESWVQVKDSKGVLWLSRILKPGDAFNAPDRSDLAMVTGNASGLAITVDGKPAPGLTHLYRTRNAHMSLDPARLLAGNAVNVSQPPKAPPPTGH